MEQGRSEDEGEERGGEGEVPDTEDDKPLGCDHDDPESFLTGGCNIY